MSDGSALDRRTSRLGIRDRGGRRRRGSLDSGLGSRLALGGGRRLGGGGRIEGLGLGAGARLGLGLIEGPARSGGLGLRCLLGGVGRRARLRCRPGPLGAGGRRLGGGLDLLALGREPQFPTGSWIPMISSASAASLS